jgi:cellobiose phosphorylase
MTASSLDPRSQQTDADSGFGHFDDAAREYVIDTPHTPWPWINYLGTDGLVGLISNTASGYCYFEDAKLRRLTRYRYNAVPRDEPGRYLYVVDGDTVWCPGWRPARTPLDEYECRHGLGYTVIRGVKNDIEVTVTYLVPLGERAELHRVVVRNRSLKARTIRLFTYLEWCLWNADADATNFQRNFSTGEVLVEGSTLYHLTEYRERRNHFAFYAANRPLSGFDTDRQSFVGLEGDLSRPAAVHAGRSTNSIAHGWSPIASHSVEVRVPAGGEECVVFVLGYIENPDSQKWDAEGGVNIAPAKEMVARLGRPDAVNKALAELVESWTRRLSAWQLTSKDARMDRLVSVWNQYQCVITFVVSRSASLFESGISRGIGFRDSNQDILGAVHMLPERSRQRILDLASTQLRDGSAYHQYQPLTKKGNSAIGSGFNDDPLWLIASTAAYVKETGDIGVLAERVPFDDDPRSDPCLFDHLRASFEYVSRNIGTHGLPLIGRADWNDCLNLNVFSSDPDESFQTAPLLTSGKAESVMIAGLYVWAGHDYAELCRRTGRAAEAESAMARIRDMERAVLDHAWDGAWYLRAFGHDGAKIGSSENREGQIFIESQGWCVMAGIGVADGRAERALDSVRALLESDHGIALVYPAFTRYQPALGEISSYPPGYKENGGVFCHTNPWIVIAETRLGRGERAFEVFRKTAPTYREGAAKLHRTEPYVYPQMIAGPEAALPGEAKNSWLTGTAAWAFVGATQYLLGIRPDFDGLCIDPCIPRSWSEYAVTRRFRGATYRIRIHNPEHVSKGVRSIEVDGEPLSGSVVPPFPLGGEHVVEVTMGEDAAEVRSTRRGRS